MLTDEELEYLDSREATLEGYRQLKQLYLRFLREREDPESAEIEAMTTEEICGIFRLSHFGGVLNGHCRRSHPRIPSRLQGVVSFRRLPAKDTGTRARLEASFCPLGMRPDPISVPQRAKQIRDILASQDRPRPLFCWSDLDAVPLLGSSSFALGFGYPGILLSSA
jgi:hypothetical protein